MSGFVRSSFNSATGAVARTEMDTNISYRIGRVLSTEHGGETTETGDACAAEFVHLLRQHPSDAKIQRCIDTQIHRHTRNVLSNCSYARIVLHEARFSGISGCCFWGANKIGCLSSLIFPSNCFNFCVAFYLSTTALISLPLSSTEKVGPDTRGANDLWHILDGNLSEILSLICSRD